MNSLVTIIIPYYNRVNVLERAIDSVINQTYTNWELLLVNDCSTDGSLEVATIYEDKRIKILETPVNGGAAAARNYGIKQAKGDFIALLDSDDVMHPSHLAVSINLLKSNNKMYFSYTGVGDLISERHNTLASENIWQIDQKFKIHKRPYLFDLHFGTSAGIIFNRKIFKTTGYFDERLRAAEDTDFFIRASEYCLGLPINYRLIFKDHQSEDRLTGNYLENAKAYKRIIDKNSNEIYSNKFLMKKWLYKAIWLNFYAGNKKQAIYFLGKLFRNRVVHPKSILITVLGLFVSSINFIRIHKCLSEKIK